MGNRGIVRLGVMALAIALGRTSAAGPVNWNQQTVSNPNATLNLNAPANWSGGFPAAGSNVFMVWTGGSNNRIQTITNAPADTFAADSLSLTNAAGGNNRSVDITVRGVANIGVLNFAGVSSGSGALQLQFNSNLTFNVINLTGGAGTGTGALTLNGVSQGGSVVFNGATGLSRLNINGPLGLTGALIVTNLNANSAGTMAGNATVAQLIVNNAANNRFTITGHTVLTGNVASVAGGFSLTGTLSLGGGGGLVLSNLAPLITGTLNVSNRTLTAKTDWANAGTVALAGGVLAGQTLTNTGIVAGFGVLSNELANAGTLSPRDGTLTMASPWHNTGRIELLGGVLAGGTTTNAGAVGGSGTIASVLVNLGSVNVEAGTLHFAALSNAANVLLRDTGTLAGQTVTNTGVIASVAGGQVAAAVFNAGTVLASNQTLNLSGGLVNRALLSVGGGANNATGLVAGVFDNRGGEIRLQAGDNSLTNAAVLIVSGTYLDSSASVVSNSNNRAAILNFTANQIVTNRGTMNFTADIIKGTMRPIDTNLVLIVAGGTNTFYNQGTIVVAQRHNSPGGPNTAPPAYVVFSNHFVNAGTMIITNTGANRSRDLFFHVSGSVTNEATGSLLLVVNGQPATTHMIVEGGGFVNAGSMSFEDTPSTTENLTLTLTKAGATFSNAPGGQFILTSSNQGTITVNADHFVNAGTNALLNGTLLVRNSSGATGFVVNSGLVLLGGGNLTAGAVTNRNGGVIATAGSGGTIAAAVVNLSSGTIHATNQTLNLASNLVNSGTIHLAGKLNVSSAWVNAGTVVFNGGTLVGAATTNASGGAMLGFGSISNLVVNRGALIASNGTLNVVSAPVQTGMVGAASSGTLNVLAAWRNTGSVNMLGGTLIGNTITNAGTITGTGTITALIINNATISAPGGGTLTLTAAPNQNGHVTILGTLNVAAAWSNSAAGTVTLNGGVLTGGTFTVDGRVAGNGTIAGNLLISNAKTVTVSGGHMNLRGVTTMSGGLIDGSGQVVNHGTLQGFGVVDRPLANPGYVRATNGTLQVKVFNNNQATGTIEVSAGATLAANGLNSWFNDGRVVLAGGTVIGGTISNKTGRVITGFGTITQNLVNDGTLSAKSAGQTLVLAGSVFVNGPSGVVDAVNQNILVTGAFTNTGTFSMMHGVGTFHGPVVNAGAWIIDPTTNYFNDTMTVTASGHIQMSAGDMFVFSNSASFVNLSTNDAAFDTLAGKFLFSSAQGGTQNFYAAGHDLGPPAAGATNVLLATGKQYSNNFALGTLEISNFSTVRVWDAFAGELGLGTNDGLPAALYVGDLLMGADSLLIISTNVQVYFLRSNDWTLANVVLENNPLFDNSINGIHQIFIVPEPSVLLLSYIGALIFWRGRRHRHNERKP